MNSKSSSTEWARNTIQEAGLRATSSRIATLLILREASAPMSHAEVASALAEENVDKATVFRNLNDMVGADLLRRSELGDHAWRFEIIDGDHEGSHPHFVCIDCGTVSCLHDVELTSTGNSRGKKLPQVTEILLRGHCTECL